jgi:4-carboxymuconolactone decarboxylase
MKSKAIAAASLALAGPGMAQERASVAPRNMQAITPALADYTDNVLFGDVWLRPELSPRDRSLVTVSALIATGKTAQLTSHLNRALENGVEPSQVAGLVTHLAFYTGWPNAVSSLGVVEQVFVERKIDVAALRGAVGEQLPLPASDAARARGVDDTVGRVAPKLAALTNDVLFEDLWRRPNLSARDRSLVTIAALAANGDDGQLAFHVPRGIENGLTRGEIFEAFTHLAFYAGWPKAMSAVGAAGKAFDGAEQPANAVPPLTIHRLGEQVTLGPASNFIGRVTTEAPFKGTGGASIGGATVRFEPGARSNWHTHPLGQLLVVTKGSGYIQNESGPVQLIRPGDTVWTAPGVKHWHGAAAESGLTHVAISEAKDGKSVDWLEPVTDEQYRKGPR